jgi:single-strand DNA-binding protein
MNLRNRVQLIGNMGKNPIVKELNKGGKMARFSLATNEFYVKDGERVKETMWHNLVAWGKTADIIAEHMASGVEVVVNGKLKNRTYNDDKGNVRYITEVVVDEVLFHTNKQ